KAKAIAGIKQDRQRQQLLQRAIQQNLSIREIRDEVREIKVAGDNSPTLTTTPTTSISDRITQLGKQAKRSKALQQPERRHEIDRLLDKLEYLLSE
ncbi:MAG: hypothetical protein NW224_17595, partial [Leptolyngbyaceae cyanobacterium bins.302]|nr:hypothetical protein [Leptolyngbyaceae cyanobacterium bins.302]